MWSIYSTRENDRAMAPHTLVHFAAAEAVDHPCVRHTVTRQEVGP